MSGNNKTEELLKKLAPCIERGELDACVNETVRVGSEMGLSAEGLLDLSGQIGRRDDFVYVLSLAATQGLEGDKKARAYYNAGRAAHSLRKLENAEKNYKKAIELNPADADTHNYYGRLLKEVNKIDEAEEHYKKAIKINHKHEWADYNYALLLQELNRIDEVEEHYKKSIEINPKNAMAYIRYGLLLTKDKKQYDKAVEVFIEANNKDALVAEISSLRNERHFEEASKLIKEALKRLPENVEILKERSWLYFDQKQYDKAVDDWLSTIDKIDEKTLQNMISSLRSERRFDEANKLIKEAHKLLPYSVRLLIEGGALYSDQGQFAQAKAFFVEAVRLAPDNLDLREQLGWFYIRQNDLISSKKEFEFILDKDSNNILGINGMGGVCFYEGGYEDAENYFRKCLDAKPKEPVWHNNFAWALVRQEKETKLDEAEKHCRIALELDPNYASAFGCLGIIAFKQGRICESEDYLLQSIQINPKEGSYVDLGALYVQMGRYEEAEEKLKEAVKIDQRDVQAHIELGNLYLQTERIKEAVREFLWAKAVNPNNENTHRALAIALMQTGELSEAEKLLRSAIRLLNESKRWQLHLTLSQLLMRLGDKTSDRKFYEEALKEVNRAKHLKPGHHDPYFYGGIVRFKLEDYKGALKDFKYCLEKDKHHFEAERNANRVQDLIRKENIRSQGSFWGGVGIGIIAVGQLVALWFLYFTGKVTETILTVLIPILLGLTVVVFLLPSLIRLKFPFSAPP